MGEDNINILFSAHEPITLMCIHYFNNYCYQHNPKQTYDLKYSGLMNIDILTWDPWPLSQALLMATGYGNVLPPEDLLPNNQSSTVTPPVALRTLTVGYICGDRVYGKSLHFPLNFVVTLKLF